MGMENFSKSVLTQEEEGLYQKAIAANPQLTKEQFMEIRSGAMEKANVSPVVHTDSDKVVAEVGEDYFESKKER